MAPPTVFSDEKNPRGIPKAFFVVGLHSALLYHITRLNALSSFQADVQEYLDGSDTEVEGTLKAFQAAIAYVTPLEELRNSAVLNSSKDSKYRYMDGNLGQRKQSLEDKIPDIQKTLDMVEFLQERRVSLFLPLVRAWSRFTLG